MGASSQLAGCARLLSRRIVASENDIIESDLRSRLAGKLTISWEGMLQMRRLIKQVIKSQMGAIYFVPDSNTNKTARFVCRGT